VSRVTRGLCRAGVFCLLALTLSGCFGLSMDLHVRGDNTVDGSLSVTVDRSVVSQTGEKTDGFLARVDRSQPLYGMHPSKGSIDSEKVKSASEVGMKYTVHHVPIADFQASDLRISREGQTFRVDGVVDLTTRNLLGDSGSRRSIDSSGVKTSVKIGFPGKVRWANGNGKVSGNTVSWKPAFGERTTVSAIGDAKGGGGFQAAYGALWALGALLAAGVGTVVTLVTYANRREGKPVLRTIGTATGSRQGGGPSESPVAAPAAAASEPVPESVAGPEAEPDLLVKRTEAAESEPASRDDPVRGMDPVKQPAAEPSAASSPGPAAKTGMPEALEVPGSWRYDLSELEHPLWSRRRAREDTIQLPLLGPTGGDDEEPVEEHSGWQKLRPANQPPRSRSDRDSDRDRE
jgi:hypothetical protein